MHLKKTSLKQKYTEQISEVTIGATRSEGGSRDRKHVIGGETTPPFRLNKKVPKNKPVVAHDIFDMPIHLPGNVREHFPSDVMNDPVNWAEYRVRKHKAEMITIHMVSTDPRTRNTPINKAVKVVEDILQAVKVPLIIGGSGNPAKDPELLEKVAEVCSGERILLSSVSPDMDYRRVAAAALEHGHAVLSLIPMNLDAMRGFNRLLIKQGLSRQDIVMDLFTGGIGYGIEYSISAMERCRIAGLRGDRYLAMPIASAPSNAWSAREAWMRNDSWGLRELRGPLWECITAEAVLFAGADLFMMLHPLAIDEFNRIISFLLKHENHKIKQRIRRDG